VAVDAAAHALEASIEFRLNGHPATLKTDPRRLLLWVLRTDLELTGTEYGCGAGICGACTVLIDGRSVRACRTALQEVHGHDLVTVEGLAQSGTLNALQQAFVDQGAL
jgi:aerobic-type carbon monoxide dehydrogenase small subunit (CoxS/CutS family)